MVNLSVCRDEKPSPEFEQILRGIHVDCEFRRRKEPPDWLDEELFRRGQHFFFQNIFGVLISNYRSLVVGLCVSNLCDPLVLTRKSHTPQSAFHRYVDTLYYTVLWYKQIPWENEDPNYNNNNALLTVNHMHRNAAKMLRDMEPDERRRNVKAIIGELPEEERRLSPEDHILLENLKLLRETTFKNADFSAYKKYVASSDRVFSQFDMSMVLLAFFGSYVLYPKSYGGRFNSERDLKAFAHTWRVFGYYCGIEDEFNIGFLDNGSGSFEKMLDLIDDLGMRMVVPGLLNINETSLIMARTVSKAFGNNYFLIVYAQCLAHGIELKQVWACLPFRQKCLYYFRLLILETLYSLPGLKDILNFLVLRGTDFFFQMRKKSSSSKTE